MVKSIRSEIKDRTGLDCWIDLEGIESDQEFVDVIISAINNLDIFLFMYSRNSVDSEYAKKELVFAAQKKKRIVFVNIDQSELGDWYKFNYSSHDIISYNDRGQQEKLFKNLIKWASDEETQKEDNLQKEKESKLQYRYKLSEDISNLESSIAAKKNSIQILKEEIEACELEIKKKKKELNSKDNFYDPFVDKMIFVEGGEFSMGDDDSDNGNKPHRVTVDTFWIGQTPVTQAEWNFVMNPDDCLTKVSDGDRPKTNITYKEVVEFIKKLNTSVKDSSKEGNPTYYYCLPTEAEWEYAARGGSSKVNFKYSGSNDPNEVARFLTGEDLPPVVKSKKANVLDIYDMSGNVGEWCHDIYENTLSGDGLINPRGPKNGKERVVRGGNYCRGAEYTTVYAREKQDQGLGNRSIGFRLVRKDNINVRNEMDFAKAVKRGSDRLFLTGLLADDILSERKVVMGIFEFGIGTTIKKYCKNNLGIDIQDRYLDFQFDNTDKKYPTILMSINDDSDGVGIL